MTTLGNFFFFCYFVFDLAACSKRQLIEITKDWRGPGLDDDVGGDLVGDFVGDGIWTDD
jgi:hypothetical protein